MTNQEPIVIGIDLGTHKTAVVASNGKRESCLSAVGWPKDHLARKMLGRDVIVGSDVIRHRLAVNIVRPFEKGLLKFDAPEAADLSDDVIKNRTAAARLLVEHAGSLVNPSPGRPIVGVIGAPSRASVKNKRLLIEAAESVFDRVLVVSEPFAVAYGVNQPRDTVIVDIGAGTVDICPMYGAYPRDEEQITVPIGGDYIDEELVKRIGAHFPEALLTLNMAREFKEKLGYIGKVTEKMPTWLPTKDNRRQFDIGAPMQEACEKLVGPIVKGIHETIAKMDPEFRPQLLKNILLSGGGSQLRGLDSRIEEELQAVLADLGHINVSRVYDSMFAGAMGAFRLASMMPPEEWDRIEKLNSKSRANSSTLAVDPVTAA